LQKPAAGTSGATQDVVPEEHVSDEEERPRLEIEGDATRAVAGRVYDAGKTRDIEDVAVLVGLDLLDVDGAAARNNVMSFQVAG